MSYIRNIFRNKVGPHTHTQFSNMRGGHVCKSHPITYSRLFEIFDRFLYYFLFILSAYCLLSTACACLDPSGGLDICVYVCFICMTCLIQSGLVFLVSR